MTLRRSPLLALSLLLAVPHQALPALTRVGAAAAVSGSVLAMAPESGEGVKAGVGRELSSGKTIYHNDKISTDAKGRMQVMLLDETVFTIGPNSEMYIDEFVYDPSNADKNKVTARVTKGVFRFVTGKVARQDPEAMKIKLPTGTMGIRGTIAGGEVSDNGTLLALLGPGNNNDAGEKPGAITVDNAGGSVEISRPGYATEISAPDQPPSEPFQLSPEQQQRLSTEPPPAGEGSGMQRQGGETASTQQTGEEQAEDSSGSGSGTSAGATESATQAAGADTAQTQEEGTLTSISNSDAQTFNQETNTASQNTALASSILDGISQWADLRTVESGTGFFEATAYGGYTCTAGCEGYGMAGVNPMPTGDVYFKLAVDFGAKTVGGQVGNDYSYVSLYGPGAGGDLLSGSDSMDIPSVLFSDPNLSGQARITLGARPPDTPGGDFSGTTIDLINQDGQAAHHAQLNLQYTTTDMYDPNITYQLTTPTPVDSGTLQPPTPDYSINIGGDGIGGGGRIVGGVAGK